MDRHGWTLADRGSHVNNVVPLHRPAAQRTADDSRRVHPSMYDGDRDLLPLSRLQRQLVASLLLSLRAHAPSPRAINEAIELLTGQPPTR